VVPRFETEQVRMTEKSIGEDLIWGAKAIAAELNQSERQTFHLLERGLLPAGKVGEKWVGSRKALRAHMLKITGALDVA
jgi:hypothetical protein